MWLNEKVPESIRKSTRWRVRNRQTELALEQKSVFGLQERYKMSDGFPAVTTKKLAWKVMVSELLWFISGSSNLEDLKAIYLENRIWDANYEDYSNRIGNKIGGEMGRIYGCQWRKWITAEGKVVDQLQNAIDLIRENPDSRRIIVNSWNPWRNRTKTSGFASLS